MSAFEKLVIPPNEVEFEPLLRQWWSWMPIESLHPLYLTQFGDWILKDATGKVFFLDLLEGTLEQIAESVKAAEMMSADPAVRNRFFLEGLIIGMDQRGVRRSPGQSFAQRIHPVIGGKVSAENAMLLGIRVWQAICSQLHTQVRALPPGTRIRGMKFVGGGEIKLVTE